MKILVAILFVAGFAGLIYFLKFFKTEGVKKHVFLLLFALKLVGGIAVYSVYTYYYDTAISDIHKFYRGGKILYEAKDESFADYLRLVTGIQGDQPELQKYYDRTDHWTREYDYGLFNDNRTIMRFNAIVCLVSGGNIFVHVVVMSFLSFLGCFVLFRALQKLLKTNKWLLIIASFLIPSCLFWTSGLMKEGLTMFALGFAFYFLVKIYFKLNILDVFGFIIASALLFASKIYVLPALLPAVLFLLLSKKLKIKQQIVAFFSIIAVSAVLVFFSGNILGYDIISNLSGKQNDFINYTQLQEDQGSTYELTRLKPDIKSFLLLIPEGLANSFFRPFPKEINSAFMLFSFLEIVLLCTIAVFAVIFYQKPDAETMRFVLFASMFVLFLYVVVGVYTPNTGSIVRYRTPALPFLTALMFAFWDFKKIRSFAQRFLKWRII